MSGTGMRMIAGNYVDAIFSSDGTQLFTVSGNTVSVYDVATGAALRRYTLGHTLGGIDLSPDGQHLAVVERYSGLPPTVYEINLATHTTASFTTTLDYREFFDVSFLPDGTALVSQQGLSGIN